MNKIEYLIPITLLIGAGIPAIAFYYYAKLSAARPLFLFVCGICLVVVGAHGANLLIGLEPAIESLPIGEVVTEDLKNKLKHSRELWLFIFPFVSAAIGTNFISQAVISNGSQPLPNYTDQELRKINKKLGDISKQMFVIIALLIVILLVSIFKS